MGNKFKNFISISILGVSIVASMFVSFSDDDISVYEYITGSSLLSSESDSLADSEELFETQLNDENQAELIEEALSDEPIIVDLDTEEAEDDSVDLPTLKPLNALNSVVNAHTFTTFANTPLSVPTAAELSDTNKGGEPTSVGQWDYCYYAVYEYDKDGKSEVELVITGDSNNVDAEGWNLKSSALKIFGEDKSALERFTLVSFKGNIILAPIPGHDCANPNESYSLLTGLKNVTDIDFGSSFNTVLLTDMSYLFHDMEKLESLDLSKFNTSNVTNMDRALCGLFSIKSLDLTKLDLSKVTNAEFMLGQDWLLEELKLPTSGDFMPALSNVRSMFTQLVSLNDLDIKSIHINDGWTETSDFNAHTFCPTRIKFKKVPNDANALSDLDTVFGDYYKILRHVLYNPTDNIMAKVNSGDITVPSDNDLILISKYTRIIGQEGRTDDKLLIGNGEALSSRLNFEFNFEDDNTKQQLTDGIGVKHIIKYNDHPSYFEITDPDGLMNRPITIADSGKKITVTYIPFADATAKNLHISKEFTLDVSMDIGPDQDIDTASKLERLGNIVLKEDYTVPSSEAGNVDDTYEWLKAKLDAMNLEVDVEPILLPEYFYPAENGDEHYPNGTNGVFGFMVKLSKDGESKTVGTIKGNIIAGKYIKSRPGHGSANAGSGGSSNRAVTSDGVLTNGKANLAANDSIAANIGIKTTVVWDDRNNATIRDLVADKYSVAWAKDDKGDWIAAYSTGDNNSTMLSEGFWTVEANGGKTVYPFDEDRQLCTGWVITPNGRVYYTDNTAGSSFEGAMRSGLNLIEGYPMVLSDKGMLMCDGVSSEGYLLDSDGYVLNPTTKNRLSAGEVATKLSHEDRVLFPAAREYVCDGWLNTSDGRKYYFKDGKIQTGTIEITGSKYYFDDRGVFIKTTNIAF